MRVVIVCEDLSSKGGIERTSELIYSYLRDKFDLQLISLANGESINSSADIVIFQGFSPNILRLATDLKQKSTAKIIVAHHGAPEVWHYFLEGERKEPLNFSYIGAKRLFKKVFWNLGYKRRGLKKIERMYFNFHKLADKIVLLSSSFKQAYCKIAKIEDDYNKFVIIPNSLRFTDLDIHIDSTSRKNLLFVGRLAGIKRVDRVLEIWRRLEPKYSDWSLRIVGDGAMERTLKSQASDLQRVTFISSCPDIAFEYSRGSILLFTSDLEGFGMVLTEAMQFGVVPVAFNSFSALSDIIENGKNGFITPAFDMDEFANNVSHLIESDDLRSSMAHYGKISISKFAPERIIPLWENLIYEYTN